jgi:uncharacterized protein with HEPN domain
VTAERDRRLLNYIADSILLIGRYLSDGGREAFENELLVQDAVLRRLETLAEAAGRLSEAVKQRHPDIPWREVYGFRNIAAHAYLDLHLERTWEIIERYLPTLLSTVQSELSTVERPGELPP